MSEEVKEQAPAPPPQAEELEIPTDFREYAKWRETGEVPPKKPPAAAEKATPPPAKTEPEPGPAEPSEPEEQEEDEEEPKDTGERKRPGSRQRRIDKLTREVEELKRVLAGQQQQSAAKPPEPPKADPTEPQLESFESIQEYIKAVNAWETDRREKKRQQEAAQQAVAEYEEKLQSDWASREKAARKLHPDYIETLESIRMPKGPIVEDLRRALLEEENGAEVLYWLAKNPAEITRIAALSPHSAVREIGKIAARLPNGASSTPSTGSDPPKKQVTSAARPPAAVTRSAGAPSDDINDPDVQSDYGRWERMRMAQLKGK